jgi:hypothetical protein
MQIIKCLSCGNTKEFYELAHIVQYNYFHQKEDGRVDKVKMEQSADVDYDSRIFCSICGEEIDDYHLFLDRYTETLFTEAR